MSDDTGNSVVVKSGIKDPEFNTDIGGFQGRISELCDVNLVCVDWDSITLNKLPASIISSCEQEGWSRDRTYLNISDIESATPRDTLKDVESVINKLQAEHAWDYLGDEGECIQSVLSGISAEDYWSSFLILITIHMTEFARALKRTHSQ